MKNLLTAVTVLLIALSSPLLSMTSEDEYFSATNYSASEDALVMASLESELVSVRFRLMRALVSYRNVRAYDIKAIIENFAVMREHVQSLDENCDIPQSRINSFKRRLKETIDIADDLLRLFS